MAVVLVEGPSMSVILFGETAERPGCHSVAPTDAEAQAFKPRYRYLTHFNRTNVAIVPNSVLVSGEQLGFLNKLARTRFDHVAQHRLKGLYALEAALSNSPNRQCECQGGCGGHSTQCTSVAPSPIALTVSGGWQLTVRGTLCCGPCFV